MVLESGESVGAHQPVTTNAAAVTDEWSVVRSNKRYGFSSLSNNTAV